MSLFLNLVIMPSGKLFALGLSIIPGTQFPKVWLAKDIRKSILNHKHPWLYDRALRGKPDISSGTVVAVVWKKDILAFGFFDPESPLRVRLLSWPREKHAHPADEKRVLELATAAALRRAKDSLLERSTGIRLIHGEADWMPGLVLDAYGSIGVVAFDGRASEAFWRPKVPAIIAVFAATGFALSGIMKKGGSETVWGQVPEGSSYFEENGVKYEVDVRRGHKTGFFLDQRENRRRLRELSKDKEVLDLFSYTGGFAVAAALGGAKRTVAVDAAAPAIAACRRNFELNGMCAQVVDKLQSVTPAPHTLYKADCWKFLQHAHHQRDNYDIVVLDPPSMAPRAQARSEAIKAYTSLNHGALKILRPGGLLITCSCSSHITRKDLSDIVKEASLQAGRHVVLEEQGSAGSDHPVRKAFPEGDYLQALYMRISG